MPQGLLLQATHCRGIIARLTSQVYLNVIYEYLLSLSPDAITLYYDLIDVEQLWLTFLLSYAIYMVLL